MATEKARRAFVAGVKRRLAVLVKEAGGQDAFCQRVWPKDPTVIHKAKVSKWVNVGKSAMHPTEAIDVAAAFHRRPAWLLFGELPERADVSRPEATLSDDLAAYVRTEAIPESEWIGNPGLAEQLRGMIDGEKLLAFLVAAVREDARANADYFRGWLRAAQALLNIKDALEGPVQNTGRAYSYAKQLVEDAKSSAPSGKVIKWPTHVVSFKTESLEPVVSEDTQKTKPSKPRKS